MGRHCGVGCCIPVALAVACFAASLVGQTTIVVQGGGANLQNAINAANHGDTLDVFAGLYDPVTVGKGLTIRCRSGVTVASASASATGITVANLPQFRTLVVDGCTVDTCAITACSGGVVFDRVQLQNRTLGPCTVSACTGPVVFHGMLIPANFIDSPVRMNVSSCSSVSFDACHDIPYLDATAANMAINHCTMAMRDHSQPTIWVHSGDVTVCGGDYISPTAFSWPAPVACIYLDSGTLTLTGGAIIRSNFDTLINRALGPGPAITTSGGTIRIDPSVQLRSPQFTPSITGPATIVNMTIPSLFFERLSLGFRLTIGAEPGSLTLTGFDFPRPMVPTPFGELWIDVRSTIFDVTIMPATGTKLLSGALPGLPPYFTLALQSVSFPAAGGFVLGAPAHLVLD
jgi:hypothetical protein